MNLPFELINHILSFRPTHPTAHLIKSEVQRYNNDDCYYTYESINPYDFSYTHKTKFSFDKYMFHRFEDEKDFEYTMKMLKTDYMRERE